MKPQAPELFPIVRNRASKQTSCFRDALKTTHGFLLKITACKKLTPTPLSLFAFVSSQLWKRAIFETSWRGKVWVERLKENYLKNPLFKRHYASIKKNRIVQLETSIWRSNSVKCPQCKMLLNYMNWIKTYRNHNACILTKKIEDPSAFMMLAFFGTAIWHRLKKNQQ